MKLFLLLKLTLVFRPSLEGSNYTKEGLEILYADELSSEGISRRRRKSFIILSLVSLVFLSTIGYFAGSTFYRWLYINNLYEQGLAEINNAQYSYIPAERENYKNKAEEYFQKALKKDGNRYNVEYLQRYGVAYRKARFYEQSFVKLFGKVEPVYSNWSQRKKVPIVRLSQNANWKKPLGFGTSFTDQSNVSRKVIVSGAYLVDRLRDKNFNKESLLALGEFHSNRARDLYPSYKNPKLAIEYYHIILNLMNKPKDLEAMAGIGNVYHKQGKYYQAIKEYQKILGFAPLDVKGNAGLLHAYLELAAKTGDPRSVFAKHREMHQSDIEEELPLYLLVQLASFYIDLDPENLLIKYQIDPVDSLSGNDLLDNAKYLLDLASEKKEKRGDETLLGSRYAEAYYQRARYLLKQKKNLRALSLLQKAYYYDPLHYLAVNKIGEYYKSIRDFERASLYFPKAIEVYQNFSKFAGSRIEDESLEKGDLAKIYYNAGSLLFLRYAGTSEASKLAFPGTRIYPFRAQNLDTPEMLKRREKLNIAKDYFEKALEKNPQKKKYALHLQYWIGWIYYMNSDFSSALRQWQKIKLLKPEQDPALLMAKANAYYYTNQPMNALGHYLKLKSDLENQEVFRKSELKDLSALGLGEKERLMLLSAVYNNMGAVYEKEAQNIDVRYSVQRNRLKELEKNSLLYYWKAIEMSRNVNLEDEIARTNVQLAFKKTLEYKTQDRRTPLIDDWLPALLPSLKIK